MSENIDASTFGIPVVYTEVVPIRIDKNVAFNISGFRVHGEDARLLKAVVLYMAINYQDEDLFGFYKLDPAKFAKTMNFTKSNLFRRHPSPYFLEHDPNSAVLIRNEENHKGDGRMSVHRTWSSYLENALYRLTHQSLIDDYRHRQEDKTIVSAKRFNFIDESRFELIKVGRNHKIMYYYKPNKKYEDNLKSYFLISKIQKYIQLRKPKLDEAYLDILNRIQNANAKGTNAIQFNIDTIAQIMQIGAYKRFSIYKRKVTEKFELLRKTIGDDVKGLQLIWVNPNNTMISTISDLQNYNNKVKYKNVVQISWSRLSREEANNRRGKVFKNIFYTELNRALISAYFDTSYAKTNILSEERKKKAFYGWIFSNENMDIKEITFKHIYVQTYKNTVSLNAFSKDFVKILKLMAKAQREHSCFSYGEDLIYFTRKPATVSFKHFYEVLTYFETHYND